jgi:hypothetical protein
MSTLTILGAAYGTLDVTANNHTFGDPWPGYTKSLVVVYRYENQPAQVTIATQNATVAINQPSTLAADAAPSKLPIYGAAYGLANVTTQVQNMVVGGTLNVVANNATGKPTLKAVVEDQRLSLQTDLPLQVLGATYGPADVTAKVKSRIDNQEIHLTADNATFGDTWDGVKKSLTVTYQYGNEQPQTAIVAEGSALNITYASRPPYRPSTDPAHLHILGAAYGLLDVRDRVAGLTSENSLIVTADNQIFEDKWPDVQKTLSVTYRYGQEAPCVAFAKEGQQLRIERNA